MVPGEAAFFRSEKLFAVGIRKAFDRKPEGVHCEKQEGGCHKNTMSRVQYSLIASNAAVYIVG